MFGKILVGVDGRAGGRDAIALARQLATPGDRLVLAHVYGTGIAVRRERRDPTAELQAARSLLTSERNTASVAAETVTVHNGSAAKRLHQLAVDESADLLVVGSSHRGPVGQLLLGDDAMRTLNGAPCAVAIAPREYASARRTIAVIGIGYDDSAESERALATARQLAEAHTATLRLRSVISPERVAGRALEADDWDEEAERLMRAEEGRVAALPGVVGDVVVGDAGEELAALGPRLDLLVVGSRSQGPLGRLMNGSTSRYLAGHLTCPLLVIPRPVSASADSAPDGPSPHPPAHAAPGS